MNKTFFNAVYLKIEDKTDKENSTQDFFKY